MNYSLMKILYSLSENGNDTAYSLLNNWDDYIARKMTPEEFLSALANASVIHRTSDSKNKIPPQLHDCDLRILSLEIEGFRGIPHRDEGGQKYGISMMHSQKKRMPDVEFLSSNPRSIVILGANGSGKTSVYSALEYLWLNNTAIAKKHRYVSAESKFYPNYKDPAKQFSISCHLICKKKYVYSVAREWKINQCVDLRNFFCSESDISLIECGGKSIIAYFNEEIGIGELDSIRKFLNSNVSTQQEKLSELKYSIESPDSPDEEDVKKINDLNKSILEITQIITEVNKEINNIRDTFYPNAQEILSLLLKDYDDGIVRPAFQSTGEKKMFNGMLEYIKTGVRIDPRTYFNNFRFKLYLVSIRIAIAFSIMKSKKIGFPLVFDDIFDSSDFRNRLKAEPFFRNVKKLYHKLEISDIPLQIIFFTQDEVIAESVFKGISECCLEGNREENCDATETIYCRLFNPEQSDETDVVKFNNCKRFRPTGEYQLKEEETIVGIEVDEECYSFKNLYDVIRIS